MSRPAAACAWLHSAAASNQHTFAAETALLQVPERRCLPSPAQPVSQRAQVQHSWSPATKCSGAIWQDKDSYSAGSTAQLSSPCTLSGLSAAPPVFGLCIVLPCPGCPGYPGYVVLARSCACHVLSAHSKWQTYCITQHALLAKQADAQSLHTMSATRAMPET